MARDDSYITRIYREQGGNKLVVGADGSIVVETSGQIRIVASGVLALSEGAFFNFPDGNNIEAEALMNQYRGNYTITQHGSADMSGAKSIVPAYGYHVYSEATTGSLGSAIIPSASKGMKLYIDGAFLAGDANLSVYTVSTVGKVVNRRGSDLSSFEISALGYVDLLAIADGTWSIVGQNNITEHASS
jgi:hypothetical protein